MPPKSTWARASYSHSFLVASVILRSFYFSFQPFHNHLDLDFLQSLMLTLDTFLRQADSAVRERNGVKLANCILLSPSEPGFTELQQHLQQMDEDETQNIAENVLGRSVIHDVIRFLLLYIRNFGAPAEPKDSAKARAGRDSRNLGIVLSNTTFFNTPGTIWFAESLRKICRNLILLATQVGIEDANGRLNRITERTILGLSAIKADSAELIERVNTVFFIANLQFSTYMKFNTIKLFSKIEQTQKLERYLDQVNKAQVVEYRYWVGRYRLLQNEPREARELLQLAFDQCPNSSRNKRQILIYLTAASIPSGYLPHPMLLYRFDLAEPFLPLINAIRSCNAHAYRSHLNDLRWMEWFSKHEILFGLKECGDVLIWRGVIKKLFRVQYPTAIEGMSTPPITFGQPAPADQKPDRKYLHYSHIAAALRISYRDASWDNDDAENVVMCLIEQGYMAGFIRHSNQTVGLDLRAPFKLPSVAVSR